MGDEARTRDETIGQNIERLRVASGMTQAEAARKFGTVLHGFKCTQQMLARIESGSRPLRLSEATAIAITFSVSIYELLSIEASDAESIGMMRKQINKISGETRTLEQAARELQVSLCEGSEVLLVSRDYSHTQAYRGLASWVAQDPADLAGIAALGAYKQYEAKSAAGSGNRRDINGKTASELIRDDLEGILPKPIFDDVYLEIGDDSATE